jgi:hypothetical protein
MKMNEPPHVPPDVPPHVPPTKPHRSPPFKRLTLGAQVVAVLLYVAVIMALLAAITGAAVFMVNTIRGAI